MVPVVRPRAAGYRRRQNAWWDESEVTEARRATFFIPVLLASVAVAVGCTPKVEVAAPKEPITINLNIKLDADVRVRLEETAKEDIKSNPDIF